MRSLFGTNRHGSHAKTLPALNGNQHDQMILASISVNLAVLVRGEKRSVDISRRGEGFFSPAKVFFRRGEEFFLGE